MFCEHQTFANFAMVDQFAKPKLLLVNTHDPCQNAIVRSQRVKFSADLTHSQRFSPAKYSSNTVGICDFIYVKCSKIAKSQCLMLTKQSSSMYIIVLGTVLNACTHTHLAACRRRWHPQSPSCHHRQCPRLHCRTPPHGQSLGWGQCQSWCLDR